MSWRALIVDDEQPARSRMRRLLGTLAEIQVLGEASNGLEALEQVEALRPDIVFLDIEMPELDGLEVARALGPKGPWIVFVTAYDEFALKAFETHAIDYLVKPVAELRLRATLDKISQRSPRLAGQHLGPFFQDSSTIRAPARFAIKTGNRYVVVDLSRVSAILAKNHYAAIQIEGRELLADEPLDAHELKLDPAKFIRVHRSAIVNLEFIQDLKREGDRKFVAILSDPAKTRVPVARERLDELKRKLGI